MQGETFGFLTVLEIGPTVQSPSGGTRRQWKCICKCERTVFADRQSLRTGNTTSCGCRKADAIARAARTHGLTRSRVYSIWRNMLNRCSNPSSEHWEDYGGRGISVCAEWYKFENFFASMGHPPSGTSIDRYPDVDGNYEPGNCRWADDKEQARNRRNNRLLTMDGETCCASEWAERLNISRNTIIGRLRCGWSDRDALTKPIHPSLGQYDRSTVMAAKRSQSYAERLASVLLLLKRGDGSPLIPKEVAEKGTKAILKHVEWDHKHPVALGGDDHFSNLQPLTAEDHLIKTKRDIKAIAKTKRLTKKQQEFRTRLLAKGSGEQPPGKPRSSIRSAGFRKSKAQRTASRPIVRNSERQT